MHIIHEPTILDNRHLELLSGYQCYQEPNGRLIGPLSPARAAWSKLWVSLFWKRKVEAKMDALSTVAPGMLGRSWTVRSPDISRSGQVRKIRRQPGNRATCSAFSSGLQSAQWKRYSSTMVWIRNVWNSRKMSFVQKLMSFGTMWFPQKNLRSSHNAGSLRFV